MNSCILQIESSNILLMLIFVGNFYSTYTQEPCNGPPDILNAEVHLEELQQFPIGTNLSITCRDGYIFNSSESAYIYCLHNNGTSDWHLDPNFCTPVCQGIPTVLHGEPRLEGRSPPFKPEESISYVCSNGYRPSDPSGPIRAICEVQNGVASWTKPQPEEPCRPASCGFPGDIDNARHIGNSFTFPNNVTYVCNEGFKLTGSASIFCSATGQWRPSLPSCEAIVCPSLIDPQHGKVILSEKRYKAIATYECNRNFLLKGSSQRVCQTDGTWSESAPSCEEIFCTDPGVIQYGRAIPNRTVNRAGDVLIFVCDEGHTLTSKCLETGLWSKRPPVCPMWSTTEKSTSYTPTTAKPTTDDVSSEKTENSCDDLGDIRNGKREITGFTPNSTVTYSCEDGYELRGKGTLMCLETGKWNLDKLPICVQPISVPTIVGIVIGVILAIAFGIGGYFCYRWREKKIRGYGEKSKALTADATDMEEISGLEKTKKPIPVTVL